MKHEIQNIKPLTFERKPIRLQVIDEDGRPEFEKVDGEDRPKLYEATLADCLKRVIKFLPREALAITNNIIQATRLYTILDDAKDTIVVKDGSYNWMSKMLEETKVMARDIEGKPITGEDGKSVFISLGASVFGLNIANILVAWKGKEEYEAEEEIEPSPA